MLTERAVVVLCIMPQQLYGCGCWS